MSLFDSVLSSVSTAASDVSSTVLGSVGDAGTIAGSAAGVLGGILSADAARLSPWGHLSTYLIGEIYACDADGVQLSTEMITVTGPITDSQFELSFNWNSPFENVGPESKAPALMALLQTGQLATVVNALQSAFPSIASNSIVANAADSAESVSKDLEGRTGITKLNSRQVFSGMPPIKIPLTMHFRAMVSSETEVQIPYQTLLRWALPQSLAKDGVLSEVIKASPNGAGAMIKALFPSRAPLMVGFRYGNQNYAPLVIESMSHPLDGPVDANGRWIYKAIQLSLSTLTALDRQDVTNIYTPRGLV